MFSNDNFCVEHVSSTPESNTMFSHKDFTSGEFSADTHIMSVGIFLNVRFVPVPTCFLKQISASLTMASKSLQGVTRPPRLRAEIKLFAPSADFSECTNASNSSLLASFLFLDFWCIFETIYPVMYDRGRCSEGSSSKLVALLVVWVGLFIASSRD